jgi:heme exporter protein CcmD
MNQWLFVTAAYGVTLGATVALIGWSYVAMRAAERERK